MKIRKDKRFYILYSLDDRPVAVFEDQLEIARYLGRTYKSMKCCVSRTLNGKEKTIHDKKGNVYRLFVYRKEEDMEYITKNKTDWMKDVVNNYKGCGHKEYYGMLHWRDGLEYCRRCIHQIWVKENPNGWKPSPDEKYFPLYSDGINYYEKDLEVNYEKNNQRK